MRLLLFILLCFQMGCKSDLDRLRDQENKAVVKYSMFLSGGTAFYVSPTELISAKHVCLNNYLKLSDGNNIKQVKYIKNYDLCYIKVEKPSKHFLKLSSKLVQSKPVCVSGFQNVTFYRVNCGNIVDFIHFKSSIYDLRLYGGSFYLIPGMSGGPVIQNGEVVGVNIMQGNLSLHGFFQPLVDIKSFLRVMRRENK